ncbi:hypothetical protein TWF594_001073 [Orbilia oligospora]|nr:hypothetical protein TWF594_001073 [Orbilia oligospora]KAF3134676.1 hypothetical protein TWF703_006334 [Orbilia oligospora]
MAAVQKKKLTIGPDTSSIRGRNSCSDSIQENLVPREGPYDLFESYGPRHRRQSFGPLLIEAGEKISTLEEETHNQKVKIRSLQSLLGFAFARIEKLEEFIRLVPRDLLDDPEVGEVYDKIWGPWDVAHGFKNRNRLTVPNLFQRGGENKTTEDQENEQPGKSA